MGWPASWAMNKLSCGDLILIQRYQYQRIFAVTIQLSEAPLALGNGFIEAMRPGQGPATHRTTRVSPLPLFPGPGAVIPAKAGLGGVCALKAQ